MRLVSPPCPSRSEVSLSDAKILCIGISPSPTAETIRSGTLDGLAERNRAVGSGGWVEYAGSAGRKRTGHTLMQGTTSDWREVELSSITPRWRYHAYLKLSALHFLRRFLDQDCGRPMLKR